MAAPTDRFHPCEAEKLAGTYLELMLQARRNDALRCIQKAIARGASLSDIYLKVLQPVMYETGRLWQTNAIDIAVEHYITAATQLTMAHIFPHALSKKRTGKKMVGGCLGSELHQLGLHMLCDLFESEGWDTYFMGAATPGKSFLTVVSDQHPDLLCISVTMQRGVPEVRETIELLRAKLGADCPKILVGGLPFILSPGLAAAVGADGTGTDGAQAVALATQLTS
ncbi:cobalamin B12-binding domain protein [Oleidesulfovibrio alaskensis G20]|jgi:methanogenic corrinoid protein MtbC1|uniref:Cobalamin B12-binding domain protein n=1 Tax=Oleidesulfovibrio alaskensis (strain ATCC BAA-1058 / DSM 17464 / G20) TaxID=207559 RepID=Q30WR6_OLEA2|nr:cobalamin-dependent protein [Oleidesulfovibrio alaskensis]ABB39880.2 cobalamin B12-binding domain protein [Oleidesulfovibrio alaskensis G20]